MSKIEQILQAIHDMDDDTFILELINELIVETYHRGFEDGYQSAVNPEE